MKCVPDINAEVERYESVLKKSFSDTINDSVFKYITEVIPYDKKFWTKMSYKMDIF